MKRRDFFTNGFACHFGLGLFVPAPDA